MDFRLDDNTVRRLAPAAVLLCGIALIVAILTLSGCGRQERSRRAVAVSFAPQATVAEHLVGDSLDIVTLVKPSADAETYDPSMSEMTALHRADLYLTLGTPGFEQSILPRLRDNFPSLGIVRVGDGIERETGTHGAGASDPHLWSSVRNMREIASDMAENLALRWPDMADSVRSRAEREDARLKALDDILSRRLAAARGKAFVVMHPSLTYFARDYGLCQVAVETDGKETTARQMRQRLDSAAAMSPLVMIVEQGHNPSQAAALALQLGLDTINVQLNSSDWEAQLLRVADVISEKAR